MDIHGSTWPRVLLAFALAAALPGRALTAPATSEHRVPPGEVSALPSYVQRVAPSIVALKVRNGSWGSTSMRG